MKDWEITKAWCETAYERSNDIKYLMHKHKNFNVGCGRSVGDGNYWFCLECGKQAPKEICFIADLAGCKG